MYFLIKWTIKQINQTFKEIEELKGLEIFKTDSERNEYIKYMDVDRYELIEIEGLELWTYLESQELKYYNVSGYDYSSPQFH